MRDWLVVADDRTGAFEVAGLFAEIVGVASTCTVAELPDGSGVVDIGSRAMDAERAATTAAAVDSTAVPWCGHKIDSTLRGNWAHELRARQAASGRRVVLLPGWPELGRTCVGGVVHVHGEALGAVHAHLPEADLVGDAVALAEWWSGAGRVAVCDVPDTESLHSLAAELAAHDPAEVLVAGPAGALAVVFGAAFGAHVGGERAPRARQVIEHPLLVVCGSANEVSHTQVARLQAAHPSVDVLVVPARAGALTDAPAQALARDALARLADGVHATVVIVGGDTAAAVLGDEPRLVGGVAAPGMPFSRDRRGSGPLVITKAGGFGGPDALVALVSGLTV